MGLLYVNDPPLPYVARPDLHGVEEPGKFVPLTEFLEP